MTRQETARDQLSSYTIVGVYVDNGQKFCDHVLAIDAQEAEDSFRNSPMVDDSLLIVAVFEGELTPADQRAIAS